MKIKAAVLEEFGKPLSVHEVDLAEPGPGEVLVRLSACGVCHTDMYTASGVDPVGLCADGPRATRARAWSSASGLMSRSSARATTS